MNENEEGVGVGADQGETGINEQAEQEEAHEHRMSLSVDIENIGPCRKHVRITVPRSDIDHFYDDAVGELMTSASVPGFRPGKVPRKLVEKRFRKELGDQVKQNVLVQSLEQVSEDEKLDPINQPDLDVESIELPEEGDLEFEFDVEVRPEFELPDYKGLKIERPVQNITEEDVDAYMERFLSQYGQLVPHDGPIEKGDSVTLSVEFQHAGKHFRKIDELTARVRPVLAFQDAELEGFDELMEGAKPGDTREADLAISDEAGDIEMRGETVHARFTVEDVKRVRMPDLNKSFLESLGVESEEELRGQVRNMLERQAEYQQRETVRNQVLEKITESADWDLPEELVRKQVENAVRREILEMAQAGFTQQDIRARENEIRQRSISNTRKALKQHFVLDKIATEENIEVQPNDIEGQIQLMALQRGESPRRVRAQLQKSGMLENLEAQIQERKAVDLILQDAEYEDVEGQPPVENRVEGVPHSVCRPSAEVEEARPETEGTEG